MEEQKKKVSENQEQITCKGRSVEVLEREVYLGSLLDCSGNWLVGLERRNALAISKFSKLRRILGASYLGIRTRVRIFTTSVSSVLLYASECWLGNPHSILKELRKKNWIFAWKLAHTRSRKNSTVGNKDKAIAISKKLNLPGLLIRRKLRWLGDLMQSTLELPSKDAVLNKREWFEPWLFGLSWEKAEILAGKPAKWEKFIEKCVFPKEGQQRVK
jgi:hypothetical protein